MEQERPIGRKNFCCISKTRRIFIMWLKIGSTATNLVDDQEMLKVSEGISFQMGIRFLKIHQVFLTYDQVRVMLKIKILLGLKQMK